MKQLKISCISKKYRYIIKNSWRYFMRKRSMFYFNFSTLYTYHVYLLQIWFCRFFNTIFKTSWQDRKPTEKLRKR